jgi:hypothetical protein
MERISSVDDILGTFWKLDPQGEGYNNGAGGGVAVPETDALKMVELSSGDVDKGMNRSASEWAFQEFLKAHEAAGSNVPHLGHRSRSIIYEDNEEEKEEVVAAVVADAAAESDEVSDITASHVIAGDQDVKPTSSVSEEVEVTGALNPLFSGLRGEVNGRNQMINPQEYEHFLKYKLDLACAAVALTRVSALIPLKFFICSNLQKAFKTDCLVEENRDECTRHLPCWYFVCKVVIMLWIFSI